MIDMFILLLLYIKKKYIFRITNVAFYINIEIIKKVFI